MSIPQRREHFLSPDGVRKLTQLMKSHFDSYPEKDLMYKDLRGLIYNGSIYNFGSEILMETNKIKMNKPPIQDLTYGKDTSFYFDIDYSNLIDTYDQQCVMVCNISKDTLINSHTYHLVFNNVEPIFVIRSSNSSAGNVGDRAVSNVFKDVFYKTNDTPILVETYIDDNDDTITINHQISIKDGDENVEFYFHYNDLTEDIIDSIENDTITTKNITDDMNGLPIIWFTCESFKYLPELNLVNNVDSSGRPLLTFGTDGNGISRIYPACYIGNYPSYTEVNSYRWFLKIECRDGFEFNVNNTSKNYNVPIKSIKLMYGYAVNTTPSEIVTINIPDDVEYVVYLEKLSDYKYNNRNHDDWIFNRRTPTDYDWDSVYNHNPNYAYMVYDSNEDWYNSFINHNGEEYPLIAGFRIKFMNEYMYHWESNLVGDVSGIHVSSIGKSNNSIIEKDGFCHMIGMFDGLPSYMNSTDSFNRSHVEVYSIRDHNNMYTQLPMDKQTSGIILDTGKDGLKGRGYLISNDDAKYENNLSTSYVKPARTLARMCDIPTSMLQLIGVPNYAPAILIDWNTSDLSYTRTFCNYSDADKDRLLNNKSYVLVKGENIIFDKDTNLSTVLESTGELYKLKRNINSSIDIEFGVNATMSVYSETAHDYAIDDEFKFNIGGRYFIGKITDVVDGNPTAVTPVGDDVPITYEDIKVANLVNRESIYNTATISGNGVGLKIKISINEDAWNLVQPYVSEDYIDGLYLYKYDEYNHIWIYTYDNIDDEWKKHIQITGPTVIDNPYDEKDQNKRKFVDSYLMNLFNNNRKIDKDTPFDKIDNIECMTKTIIDIDTTGYHPGDDISTLLNDYKLNYQNTYYIPSIDDGKVATYNRYPYEMQDRYAHKYHQSILPRFNTLNLPNYFNISNRLLFSLDPKKLQPSLFIYDPNETNFIEYTNVSTDYYSYGDIHELSYYDLFGKDLILINDRYYAPDNIYRYDEYESDSFSQLRYQLSSMSRDELLVHIRNTFGDNAFPLVVETSNPFTKSMLIDYCLTIPQSTYSKSKIKTIAQIDDPVAQIIENDDGTTSVVPIGGDPITGLFKPLSSSIHDLNLTTSIDTEHDILFVFTIPKNEALVTFRHFHMYDENGIDISTQSLLIYDNSKYIFDTMRDNWIVIN